MTPFRSEIAFASLVTYCPRGEGAEIRKSQTLMRQLKDNRMLRAESAAAFVSRRVREMSPPTIVPFLGPDVALVPVPRSSLQKRGALWPALEIAEALHAQGFGSQVLPCLRRHTAVGSVAGGRVARGAPSDLGRLVWGAERGHRSPRWRRAHGVLPVRRPRSLWLGPVRRQKQGQDLVARQPASHHRADARVEGVGQRRWIPARASEVREQAAHEPDASFRVQLHEELNARADAGHGDRQGVVDVERPEDEEAPAPPTADLVRDDLAGLETCDRTEPPLADVARGAEKELRSRPLLACQRAKLHGRLHRSLPPAGPRGPRMSASMPGGAGVQS